MLNYPVKSPGRPQVIKRHMMIDSAKIKLNIPRKSDKASPVHVSGLKVNLKARQPLLA